jgi:hypothetical protein
MPRKETRRRAGYAWWWKVDRGEIERREGERLGIEKGNQVLQEVDYI